MAAAENLEVGTVVAEKYELVVKLPAGAMGEVWKARDIGEPSHVVAIKFVLADLREQGLRQRFLEERSNIARLNHPNIAKVLDPQLADHGNPCLVMEFVEGAPITDFCDAKKLTLAQRLEVFVQVCRGVQHAHSSGVVHRDLKPANILIMEVDGKPLAKVIDFGISRTIQPRAEGRFFEVTQPGFFVGTALYSSPEQLLGSGKLNPLTDLYSLGVVLYELLVGLTPVTREELAILRTKSTDSALAELAKMEAPSLHARLKKTSAAATNCSPL